MQPFRIDNNITINKRSCLLQGILQYYQIWKRAIADIPKQVIPVLALQED